MTEDDELVSIQTTVPEMKWTLRAKIFAYHSEVNIAECGERSPYLGQHDSGWRHAWLKDTESHCALFSEETNSMELLSRSKHCQP